MSLPSECDVLVVGSGNAGFCAAVAAVQEGVGHVILIDKADESWAGGNTYFTAGAYRTAHEGLDDLLPLVNNVDADLARKIDLDAYTEKSFADDMQRICEGRSDPELSRILVEDSMSAVKWLARNGVRFQLSFNRQAYEVDGRWKFWGGLHLKTQDGGKGLVEDHKLIARKHGVRTFWSTALSGLITSHAGGGIEGAVVKQAGVLRTIRTKAIVLAAGGFEANARMRVQHLGPGWDMAMVRGTPHNTGDCLEIAMRDGFALPAGHWSGCHSVAWDANANANAGDRQISNEFTKSGYPIGLMLNIDGRRFVDEGVDMRNYTYAKFGRAILAQPSHVVFQVWDRRAIPWLRPEEYRAERVERITASTIEELADKYVGHGLQDAAAFTNTIAEYNRAVYAHRRENPDVKWNPATRDGLSTQSISTRLQLAKSNWALPIDQAPFLAVKVSCGITFTFGGLQVKPENAQVISRITGQPLPGLYAVGEMLGGLFYQNYPGGSGLTSGAVFGRRAGTAAARTVKKHPQGMSKL